MKYIAFLIVIACCFSCGTATHHKTAQEIYELGKLEDTTGFVLIWKDPINKRDSFFYTFDTAFGMVKQYYENGKSLQTIAFFYKQQPAGKWTFYKENGMPEGEMNFKNGLRNGNLSAYYDNGKTKVKTVYDAGLPQYQIRYDEAGKTTDSIPLKYNPPSDAALIFQNFLLFREHPIHNYRDSNNYNKKISDD